MTSITPIRDPKQDELLTPQNSTLLIIDYQPQQVGSINSMNKSRLVENIVSVAKLGTIYQLPIILSTVNVKDGRNGDTIAPLKEVLKDVTSYDRTSINAWEDAQFKEAVKATGRKKLIICALWTEACLTFPSLDAIQDGYEAYAVVDAVGGTSRLIHMAALNRLSQAGAKLTSITQILCELQRDWNRTGTVKEFVNMLIEVGAFPEG
jgi:nicotinamidase-related amidase